MRAAQWARVPVVPLFALLAAAFVAVAVAGTLRTFSPVPFGDMWNGYLDFYVKATSGDSSAWWAQHSEHRIVLARLLFWMDIAWFSGASRFLVVVNCLLLGLVCWVFCKAWTELAPSRGRFFGFFLVAWLFCWSQEENMVWGFQSQFILAQLLPLTALYCLHLAVASPRQSHALFALAALLGVLSIGSMANGVLALPLMTVYAWVVRWPWTRVAVLAALSCLCLGLYFYGYVAPVGHGNLGQAVRSDPLGLLHYCLLYLGGPFYQIVGRKGGLFSHGLALLAGLLLVLSSVALSWRILPQARQHTLPLALLAFIAYIAASALGTAGGRLMFGVEQALSSRYVTPALMAWAALWIVGLSRLSTLQLEHHRVKWSFVLLLVLLLPRQAQALHTTTKLRTNFEQWIGVLALEMRVRDALQVGKIFPNLSAALAYSEVPVAQNLSVFGLPPLKDLGQTPGSQRTDPADPTCLGRIEVAEFVESDARFLRVSGWFHGPQVHEPHRAIRIFNAGHVGVGAALTGQARSDIASAAGNKKVLHAGFKGYVLAEAQAHTLTLVDTASGCELTTQVPAVRHDARLAAVPGSVPPRNPSSRWLAPPLTTRLSGLRTARGEWSAVAIPSK